jgi:hypothetical protein
MLAIVTSNPRFYQEAVKELEKLGERFLSLSPGDEVPPGVEIVITSEGERGAVQFHSAVSAPSAAEAVREALIERSGLGKTYAHLSIGIDPGKNIGIAAIGDRRLLFEDLLDSPEEVWRIVEELKQRFESPRVVVRIGSAGGAYRDRIIVGIQANLRCKIEIVSEEKTTGPRAESRRLGVQKDVLSARRIALKKGRPLQRKIIVSTTEGEIRNVQRESRKKSGNLTVSKELAEAVVKGEITLEEAIRRQANGEANSTLV